MSIPISAAKRLAEWYDYDQVIVIARKVGSHEHVTTYGVDKENCAAAAKIGDFLKYDVMKWPREDGYQPVRTSDREPTPPGDE